MEYQHYYLELSNNPIRFDAVSQLTNVFFDDSKQQVFAVRSGGATGIVVKSANDSQNVSFCMDERGSRETIRSIKFSPDNLILAVQRNETSVEFIQFTNSQPNLNDIIIYKGKNSTIFGFVWVHDKQVVLISSTGVEIYQVMFDKKQLKSLKSSNLTVNWFSWCPTSNFALLSSNDGTILTPIILKPGTITKLPRLELGVGQNCSGRDVTLGQLYGTNSIMILKQSTNRSFEVIIYLLNGPGLAPKKAHVLRLGHTGRFAMNIVDDLIIVHHQASATSMLFDIALSGETDPVTGVVSHAPLIPGRPLKPFSLELPSISLDGKTMNCELYSQNWVLFQPNIVIDAKLGCLWYVKMKLDAMCTLMIDRVRLTEFLLQRTNGKTVLLNVLKEMMSTQYNGTSLPIIENVFDKLNLLYKSFLDSEVQSQMGTPSSAKVPSKPAPAPRVLVDQSDMYTHVFSAITDSEHIGKILLLYLYSLAKHGIAAQHELSKTIIIDLVKNRKFETLHQLLKYSSLNESKPLACFLLSLSNADPSISQMALDMLARLNANEIIIEVLLEKGQVIDALRIAAQMPGADSLPARKYLEAATKTRDALVFHSTYKFFQMKNMRIRGSPDFMKHEQCGEYIQYYQTLINSDGL